MIMNLSAIPASSSHCSHAAPSLPVSAEKKGESARINSDPNMPAANGSLEAQNQLLINRIQRLEAFAAKASLVIEGVHASLVHDLIVVSCGIAILAAATFFSSAFQ